MVSKREEARVRRKALRKMAELEERQRAQREGRRPIGIGSERWQARHYRTNFDLEDEKDGTGSAPDKDDESDAQSAFSTNQTLNEFLALPEDARPGFLAHLRNIADHPAQFELAYRADELLKIVEYCAAICPPPPEAPEDVPKAREPWPPATPEETAADRQWVSRFCAVLSLLPHTQRNVMLAEIEAELWSRGHNRTPRASEEMLASLRETLASLPEDEARKTLAEIMLARLKEPLQHMPLGPQRCEAILWDLGYKAILSDEGRRDQDERWWLTDWRSAGGRRTETEWLADQNWLHDINGILNALPEDEAWKIFNEIEKELWSRAQRPAPVTVRTASAEELLADVRDILASLPQDEMRKRPLAPRTAREAAAIILLPEVQEALRSMPPAWTRPAGKLLADVALLLEARKKLPEIVLAALEELLPWMPLNPRRCEAMLAQMGDEDPALGDGEDRKLQRLRSVRRLAGFETAWKAADAHGWPHSSYIDHENGRRSISPEDLRKYARAFGVRMMWLSRGGGVNPDRIPTDAAAAGARKRRVSEGLSEVREYSDQEEAPAGHESGHEWRRPGVKYMPVDAKFQKYPSTPFEHKKDKPPDLEQMARREASQEEVARAHQDKTDEALLGIREARAKSGSPATVPCVICAGSGMELTGSRKSKCSHCGGTGLEAEMTPEEAKEVERELKREAAGERRRQRERDELAAVDDNFERAELAALEDECDPEREHDPDHEKGDTEGEDDPDHEEDGPEGEDDPEGDDGPDA
jgi:hypothetical protein